MEAAAGPPCTCTSSGALAPAAGGVVGASSQPWMEKPSRVQVTFWARTLAGRASLSWVSCTGGVEALKSCTKMRGACSKSWTTEAATVWSALRLRWPSPLPLKPGVRFFGVPPATGAL